jgi:hypothetical protein
MQTPATARDFVRLLREATGEARRARRLARRDHPLVTI